MLADGLNSYQIQAVFLVVNIIQQKNHFVKYFFKKILQYLVYDKQSGKLYKVDFYNIKLTVYLYNRKTL